MCFRSLFLPDVVADQFYSLDVADGVNTDSINIPKGSWFANAPSFVAWLNTQLTLVDPFTIHLERNTDGSVKLVNSSSNKSAVWVEWTSGSGSMLEDLGSLGVTGVAGDFEEWTTPGWSTTFPPRSYAQGVTNLDGQISYSHDGTSFSLSGDYQRKIQLGVHLDRRENAREYVLWRALWRRWWAQGRSVSFWLEEPLFADGAGEMTIQYALNWGEEIGKLDQLVVEPRAEVWRPERLIQSKENRDFDEGDITFWVKKNRNPVTDTYMDFLWIPS